MTPLIHPIFGAMLDVERYGRRTSAFNKIISATNDHFWGPLDKDYINFDKSWDLENDYLIDPELTAGFDTAVWDKLSEKERVKLANLDAQWAQDAFAEGLSDEKIRGR